MITDAAHLHRSVVPLTPRNNISTECPTGMQESDEIAQSKTLW